MKRTRLLLFAAPALGVLLLGACGDDDSDDGGTGDTTGGAELSIEGPLWLLTDAGEDADAGAADSTLRLEGGTASGNSGCNSFSGGYTIDGDSLTFGALASTAMACADPAVDALETVVLAGLEATVKYEIVGETLVLEDADGSALLSYSVAPEASLTGSWEIIGYLTADQSAFTTPVIDSGAELSFADDGTMSGSTGCNSVNGPYTVDGDSVSFGALATTKMACEPDLTAQEAGILAALDTAATFTGTAGGGIEIFDAEGMRVLQLAPAS
jgi:heat shock protein HslJ